MAAGVSCGGWQSKMAQKKNAKNIGFHEGACHVGPEMIHELISSNDRLHTSTSLIENKLIHLPVLDDEQTLLVPKGILIK